MQQNRYDKEPMTAVEAQRLAQEIAFGPIVFQVSRLMLKFGIFQFTRRPTRRTDTGRNQQGLRTVLLCRTGTAGSIVNNRYRPPL